jgi:hypothetical protein
MLGVELSGPILSELSRTSGHSVRYPSFYLKVDLNMKKITSRTLTISFLKAKMELKEVRGMFSDLHLPTDSEFLAQEELTAALRPLEALATNLCRDKQKQSSRLPSPSFAHSRQDYHEIPRNSAKIT